MDNNIDNRKHQAKHTDIRAWSNSSLRMGYDWSSGTPCYIRLLGRAWWWWRITLICCRWFVDSRWVLPPVGTRSNRFIVVTFSYVPWKDLSVFRNRVKGYSFWCRLAVGWVWESATIYKYNKLVVYPLQDVASNFSLYWLFMIFLANNIFSSLS